MTATVPVRWREAVPDYPEVGASRNLLEGGPTPPGYRLTRVRLPLGTGAEAAARAGEALLGWDAHRGAGARVVSTGSPIAVGDTVVSMIGFPPLRVQAPCRVLWVLRTTELWAFGYGTLPGHPVVGEEGFAVALDTAGRVWFAAASFSRPVRRYARLAGPLLPIGQRLFLHGCARALRRAGRG